MTRLSYTGMFRETRGRPTTRENWIHLIEDKDDLE